MQLGLELGLPIYGTDPRLAHLGTKTGSREVFEKINSMCEQFASDELRAFHGVKSAFDPHGLLNPGKAVPTLHRCAEMGRMHVHAGQLRFPELERL